MNRCSRNACVFLPFENIVLVSVMCGYRLARVGQQCVNQRGSLKLRSTVGFLRSVQYLAVDRSVAQLRVRKKVRNQCGDLEFPTRP